MPSDPRDPRLRGLLSGLPEAPEDPAFRRRVLAVAALTPQEGRLAAPNGAITAGWSFWVAAAAGLCAGVALAALVATSAAPGEGALHAEAALRASADPAVALLVGGS
jgi:hypothetical protein